MQQNIIPSHAGTLESSDLFVRILPKKEGGVSIELESSVCEIYADAIKKTVLECANAFGADGMSIIVQDKGALDYVIKARVQTALLRAFGMNELDWSVL
ncbi:MAG: citrate lyase acyl carrier protein [Sulfurospirillum sp.]|nr:citrate lyase acyl carrier protein [Sulfurospirillum sp.]